VCCGKSKAFAIIISLFLAECVSLSRLPGPLCPAPNADCDAEHTQKEAQLSRPPQLGHSTADAIESRDAHALAKDWEQWPRPYVVGYSAPGAAGHL